MRETPVQRVRQITGIIMMPRVILPEISEKCSGGTTKRGPEAVIPITTDGTLLRALRAKVDSYLRICRGYFGEKNSSANSEVDANQAAEAESIDPWTALPIPPPIDDGFGEFA